MHFILLSKLMKYEADNKLAEQSNQLEMMSRMRLTSSEQIAAVEECCKMMSARVTKLEQSRDLLRKNGLFYSLCLT